MKTRSILFTALLSLILSVVTASQAAGVLLSKIVEITPAQAAVGQTITFRTQTLTLGQLPANLKELKIARRGVIPGFGGALKVFFTGANGQQTVEGQNLVSLGNNTYSVRVPNGARTGKLRLQRGISSSLSTPTFTVVSTGYTVANFGQFNIISVKVDNVERISGQVIAATPVSAPNVFVADIGATAGNHSIQVTLGRSASEPVFVYFLPSVQATSPFNPVQIGNLLAGEYLTGSPNATISAGNITASWQTVIVNATGDLSVNGFDFTYNATSGTTTWKHWVGDRPNVTATGTVTEPTSWPLNPATTTLSLRNSNGSVFTNVTVNFLNKTMLASGDGNTYELQ